MSINGASSSTSARGESYSLVALCRDLVRENIDKNPVFKTTLGSVDDIEIIMTNLFQKESSIDASHYISKWSDYTIRKHVNVSRTARKFLRLMNFPETAYRFPDNIKEGILPHGVGQVMGWHLVKGATGFYESIFDKVMTADNSPFYVTISELQASPGGINGAINSKFSDGSHGLTNGIIASLAMLHTKFPRSVKDPNRALLIALSNYLGDSKAADVFGSRPLAYATEISNVNGPLNVARTSSSNIQLAAGPTTNNTGGSVGKPACA